MPGTSRVGTGLLGTFGLALAGLMAYTLAFEGFHGTAPPPRPDAVAAEVAVFFPDRRDWAHFRRAVAACVARGLARAVADDDDAVVVAGPKLGRRVRFAWHGIRGVGETADAVRRLADGHPAPVAVVGSSTTVLTVALAGPLRDLGPAGPVLLIPWATSVRAGLGGLGSAPEKLLEIDRGRTFRFCPDNERLANSVVECLVEQDPGNAPGRVFLVVDRHDPYSVDLAGGFRRAIGARAPGAEVVERADALGEPSSPGPPGSAPAPSAAEKELADAIWTAADEAGEGRTVWAVLPLQGAPTRRMLVALRRRASWRAGGRSGGALRVVTGDGIGRETLDELAGHRPFPIWCASTSSARSPDHGVSTDTQELAEIAASLILAVERSPRPSATADDVRDALAGLDLAAGDPSAFGRPLAFGPDGERRGDPGHVLAVRPGSPSVIEFARGAGGRWEPAAAPSGARP